MATRTKRAKFYDATAKPQTTTTPTSSSYAGSTTTNDKITVSVYNQGTTHYVDAYKSYTIAAIFYRAGVQTTELTGAWINGFKIFPGAFSNQLSNYNEAPAGGYTLTPCRT